MKNATLSCTVAPGGPALPGDFAAEFCRALADAMKNDVRIVAGPLADGFRIAIAVLPVNAHHAKITIETTTLSGGIATNAKTTASALTSHDATLSAASAGTLAFPVGRQLGLF